MPLSSFFVAVLFCDLLYLVILCPSVNEVILYIAGIIYDVIVEPPSIGSTTDEHGHSKPVCYFFIYLFLYCLTYIKNKELRKISTSNHAVSIILAVDRQSLVSTSIFTSSRSHQYLWSNNCISHSSLCCYIARRTLFIIAPH